MAPNISPSGGGNQNSPVQVCSSVWTVKRNMLIPGYRGSILLNPSDLYDLCTLTHSFCRAARAMPWCFLILRDEDLVSTQENPLANVITVLIIIKKT